MSVFMLGKGVMFEKGRGDEFHRTAFRAYFAEGRNIARKEVLIDLACRAGLPGEGGPGGAGIEELQACCG